MAAPLPSFESVAMVLLERPELRVAAANGAFLKLAGLRRREVIGATLRQLHIVLDGYEKAEPGRCFELTWRLPSGEMRLTLSRLELTGEREEAVLLSVDLTDAIMPDGVAGVLRAERAHLARVFHDGVAQEIGAAGFLAELLGRHEIPADLEPYFQRLAGAVERCRDKGATFAETLKREPPL